MVGMSAAGSGLSPGGRARWWEIIWSRSPGAEHVGGGLVPGAGASPGGRARWWEIIWWNSGERL
jgi:hypothetical protein